MKNFNINTRLQICASLIHISVKHTLRPAGGNTDYHLIEFTAQVHE